MSALAKLAEELRIAGAAAKQELGAEFLRICSLEPGSEERASAFRVAIRHWHDGALAVFRAQGAMHEALERLTGNTGRDADLFVRVKDWLEGEADGPTPERVEAFQRLGRDIELRDLN